MAERERIGTITFFNVYDYISSGNGRRYKGCLLYLQSADSKVSDVLLFVETDKLQSGALIAYGKGTKVNISYSETNSAVLEEAKGERDIVSWLSRHGDADGPFTAKAIFTL